MGLFKGIKNFFKGALGKVGRFLGGVGKGVLKVANFAKPLIRPIATALTPVFGPASMAVGEALNTGINVANNIKDSIDKKKGDTVDKAYLGYSMGKQGIEGVKRSYKSAYERASQNLSQQNNSNLQNNNSQQRTLATIGSNQ